MSLTRKLRARLLSHLLVGGAATSMGCITDSKRIDRADASPHPPLSSECTARCCEVIELPISEEGCPDPEERDTEARVAEQLSWDLEWDMVTAECCLSRLEGPFAPSGHDACAYIARGIWGCPEEVEGRPFIVRREPLPRRAPAVSRADWV